jgi:hypothetical protein
MPLMLVTGKTEQKNNSTSLALKKGHWLNRICFKRLWRQIVPPRLSAAANSMGEREKLDWGNWGINSRIRLSEEEMAAVSQTVG